MNVSIFGLGYVGLVASGWLSQQGHLVIGVDVDPKKVEALNEGKAPICEPGLDALLQSGRQAGRLFGTEDAADAISRTDVSMICVGTPSTDSCDLNLGHVQAVVHTLFGVLATENKPTHVVLLRSTLLPGTTRKLADRFQRIAGVCFLYCPEFLREGSAVEDLNANGLLVVGTKDGEDPGEASVRLLGGGVELVTWEEAELLKFACNYFHALKVAFANEIGRLAKACDANALRIMEVFRSDTRLNSSAAYLRPGAPFGGSCLEKDVKALEFFSQCQQVSTPVLANVIKSNEAHLQAMFQAVLDADRRHVCVLGITFKNHTDDLRASSFVALVEMMISGGLHVAIYEPTIQFGTAQMISGARCYDRVDQAIQADSVVVAAHPCVAIEVLQSCVTENNIIIDVNGWTELRALPSEYRGLCWQG